MHSPGSLFRSARRVAPWLLLFLGVFWVSRNVRPSAAFAVGEHLPSLAVELADGSHFVLDGAPGRVVVLSFWASYCAPCRDEAPLLSAAAARGVRVVGLSVDAADNAELQKAARDFGIGYPVGVSDKSLVKRFSVQSIPTTYVIAPNGSIVLSRVGSLGAAELEAALQSAQSEG